MIVSDMMWILSLIRLPCREYQHKVLLNFPLQSSVASAPPHLQEFNEVCRSQELTAFEWRALCIARVHFQPVLAISGHFKVWNATGSIRAAVAFGFCFWFFFLVLFVAERLLCIVQIAQQFPWYAKLIAAPRKLFTGTEKKAETNRQTDRRTEVVQLNADTKRISINVINLPDDLTNCEMKPARMEGGGRDEQEEKRMKPREL